MPLEDRAGREFEWSISWGQVCAMGSWGRLVSLSGGRDSLGQQVWQDVSCAKAQVWAQLGGVGRGSEKPLILLMCVTRGV